MNNPTRRSVLFATLAAAAAAAVGRLHSQPARRKGIYSHVHDPGEYMKYDACLVDGREQTHNFEAHTGERWARNYVARDDGSLVLDSSGEVMQETVYGRVQLRERATGWLVE